MKAIVDGGVVTSTCKQLTPLELRLERAQNSDKIAWDRFWRSQNSKHKAEA